MGMTRIILLIISIFNFIIMESQEKKFGLVIHGGAGTIKKENLSKELEAEYFKVMNEALKAGYEILEKGGSALAAVEAAIIIMEDSPLFNAGKGSVFSHDEKNELDASIMDGKTGGAGAVSGVGTIKNPITTARFVMEKSPHVLLSGKGAEIFAEKMGQVPVPPSYFFDARRFEQLKKIKETDKIKLDHSSDTTGMLFPDTDYGDKKFGTVGCVALDKNGNLAAGTSTGGMTNKKFGRVGEAPIIGAGTFAQNSTCSISCTGHGEYFIRNVVAYDVSALMEYKGMSLDAASNLVIQKKLKEQGGEGGLIGIDKKGNIVMPFNTSGMYRGYMINGKSEVKIYKD